MINTQEPSGKPGQAPGPWRTDEQVELATLERVWSWNEQRLHDELGLRTPMEVEAVHYAELESAPAGTRQPGKPKGTKHGPTQAAAGQEPCVSLGRRCSAAHPSP